MIERRTVEDGDGNRYLLLKQSDESSLVRDLETGETQYLPTATLEPVAGGSPLATAAGELPAGVRTLLVAVPDERALGLLLELDADGPLPVRTLLSASDLCESDLHGLLAEFRAAGLIADSTVAGARGYETTYDLCESDLHGLLAELRVAGLLAETTVAGERGYETTDDASETLATLRHL